MSRQASAWSSLRWATAPAATAPTGSGSAAVQASTDTHDMRPYPPTKRIDSTSSRHRAKSP